MARCDALEKLRKEREEKRLAVHAAAIKQLLEAKGDWAWDFRIFAKIRIPPEHRRGMNPPAESRKPAEAGSPCASYSTGTSALQGAFRDETGDLSPGDGNGMFIPANLLIGQHFGALYTVKENVNELRKLAILHELAVMGLLLIARQILCAYLCRQ
jgi:hypothetical protein